MEDAAVDLWLMRMYSCNVFPYVNLTVVF